MTRKTTSETIKAALLAASVSMAAAVPAAATPSIIVDENGVIYGPIAVPETGQPDEDDILWANVGICNNAIC